MLNEYEDTAEVRALKRRYGLNESVSWEQDLKVKNVLANFRANAIKVDEVAEVMHDVLDLRLPMSKSRELAESMRCE